MSKNKKSSRNTKELDSVYFLKLVLFFVVGTWWIHIDTSSFLLPVPLGLPLGLWFASHDHFQIDRKIEYAVLVIAVFISYFFTPKLILSF